MFRLLINLIDTQSFSESQGSIFQYPCPRNTSSDPRRLICLGTNQSWPKCPIWVKWKMTCLLSITTRERLVVFFPTAHWFSVLTRPNVGTFHGQWAYGDIHIQDSSLVIGAARMPQGSQGPQRPWGVQWLAHRPQISICAAPGVCVATAVSAAPAISAATAIDLCGLLAAPANIEDYWIILYGEEEMRWGPWECILMYCKAGPRWVKFPCLIEQIW